MQIKKICLLGGTGFVGKVLANQLSQSGYEVRIITRHREQHRESLILLPNIELVQADVYNKHHLLTCFQDCDAIINLIGILNEKGRSGDGFYKAHVEIVDLVIETCRTLGIQRILQMSALNADKENGPSHYLKTKGLAEYHLFQQQDMKVTSYRPSVIFGKHDSFFNRFATLLQSIPMFFPLACPHAKFSPVLVNDVTNFMVKTLNNPGSYGKTFDLVGPEEFTLQELVAYTASCLKLKRTIIPLNNFFSRIQAAIFDFVPGKPFSTDNYLSCKLDSTSQINALTEFSIEPTAISSVVPYYLTDTSIQTQYDSFRSHL